MVLHALRIDDGVVFLGRLFFFFNASLSMEVVFTWRSFCLDRLVFFPTEAIGETRILGLEKSADAPGEKCFWQEKLLSSGRKKTVVSRKKKKLLSLERKKAAVFRRKKNFWIATRKNVSTAGRCPWYYPAYSPCVLTLSNGSPSLQKKSLKLISPSWRASLKLTSSCLPIFNLSNKSWNVPLSKKWID